MSDKNGRRGGGISFTALLGITFIVLKLCGVIEWSWTWVLAPIWIPASIGILILVFAVIKVLKEDT